MSYQVFAQKNSQKDLKNTIIFPVLKRLNKKGIIDLENKVIVFHE